MDTEKKRKYIKDENKNCSEGINLTGSDGHVIGVKLHLEGADGSVDSSDLVGHLGTLNLTKKNVRSDLPQIERDSQTKSKRTDTRRRMDAVFCVFCAVCLRGAGRQPGNSCFPA